jgi:hypothetical protein
MSEVSDETNIKLYCKSIYANPKVKEKAKIELHVSTSLSQTEWLRIVGDYLQGMHHSRVYLNNTTGPNSINVGFGVMSSPWCNLHAMGKRLSEAAGIDIGCKSGNIVLPSEQSTYVYSPGTGVQAVMFYADREDQQQATAYLDELLTGEYTNTQIELCPIMKFCIKPGILSGGNQEKINFKMKKNQEHFLQASYQSSLYF